MFLAPWTVHDSSISTYGDAMLLLHAGIDEYRVLKYCSAPVYHLVLPCSRDASERSNGSKHMTRMLLLITGRLQADKALDTPKRLIRR